MNIIHIDGHKAVLSFDSELRMFRGEFVELNGGADFLADNVQGLMEEGRRSLDEFLAVCRERGIEPRRSFSGAVSLRMSPDTHATATVAAAAKGVSLNQYITQAVEHENGAVAA